MASRKLPATVPRFGPHTFLFAPVNYTLPAVNIQNGSLYKQYATPGSHQEPLFKDLNLRVGHPAREQWAIVGPAGAGKTTFLQILRGRCACEPTTARTWPAISAAAELRGMLSSQLSSLIQYLPATGREGMLAGAAAQGAYLSARYESGHEASDLTLSDYLTGNLYQNPDPTELARVKEYASGKFYERLLKELHLTELANQPLSTLSNGQTRRARIARALVPRPAMLLMDEPFLGLDPMSQKELGALFTRLAREHYLCLVFAFEQDQAIPGFVTHLLYLNAEHQIVAAGRRDEVLAIADQQGYPLQTKVRKNLENNANLLQDLPRYEALLPWFAQTDSPAASADLDVDSTGEERPTVVEMSGVRVRYGDNVALGSWNQDVDGEQRPGLWWRVRQGERWGIFGANGAGKTTLLSMINSDHPQAYGQPVQVFDRGRLPVAGQSGLSVFDLQARIGQASPEIHNFFPRDLTIRQSLENAWAETFRSAPKLTHEADVAIDATLRWFEPLLNPACARDIPGAMTRHANASPSAQRRSLEEYRDAAAFQDWAEVARFGDLDFAAQRIVLFLRAVIRKPDLVVLDEAFGGMSHGARIRCMLWLAYGERRSAKFPGRPSLQSVNISKHSSSLERGDAIVVDGLEPRQALLCVAHRREDVPPILNRWMLLPPDGGKPRGTQPRFGTFGFKGVDWRDGDWWDEMWWGQNSPKEEEH